MTPKSCRLGAVLLVLLAVCGIALFGNTARAEERVLEYRIQHPVFGHVGTYTNTVKAAGETTEVHTQVQVTVNIAGNLFYRQNATRREQWAGDRLVAFSGLTQTNEERFEVQGEARGDGFVISTAHGMVTAPAGVRPANPWSLSIARAETMFAPMTGRLFQAQVTGREEPVRLADGRTRILRRYEIVGDKRQVVWFDEAGVPLAFRSEEGGVNIDFVLSQAPDPESKRADGR